MLSSHPEKVRMLVLETDDSHPETQKEQGGFGDVLGKLFKEAGDEHVPQLGIETLMHYVIEEKGGRVPKVEEIGDEIHAIMITGSVYDAHSDVEWIKKLMKFIKGTNAPTDHWGSEVANDIQMYGSTDPISGLLEYVSATKSFVARLGRKFDLMRRANGKYHITQSS
jgi:hypothetical protein